MLYPQVDPKEWARIYGLALTIRPCLKCGKLLEKTIPFAFRKTRGLKSAPHGCPGRYDHTVSISLDPEVMKHWDRLRGRLE